MNFALLCIGFEVPKMISNLAIVYPDSSVVPYLYYLASLKFDLWDMYRFQTQCDNTLLSIPMGILLLLNIGRFFSALSVRLKPHLDSNSLELRGRYISAFVYFVRAYALYSTGLLSENMVMGHTLVAVTAHAYFTDGFKSTAHCNYYFYTLALHTMALIQMWEALEATPMLFVASVYVHFLSFLQQFRSNYLFEENPILSEFITHFSSSWDFFVLHLVARPYLNDLELWNGSLQLFAVFMLLFFESFGKLTIPVTHVFFALHSVTVTKLCALSVKF